MSDSIENQINQYTLEQNSSPQVPTFRSKKNKNKILAAVALIMLLAVGAISSFILLGQKQDTRNQASVANGLINIRLQKNIDCMAGQTCYVDVLVNTGSSNIDALQAKIVFDQNSLGSVDSISFTPVKDAQTPPTLTPTLIPTSTPIPTKKTCQSNTDCTSGQICYQPPMKACPEGKFCPQMMPVKYCADNNTKHIYPTAVSATDNSGISFEENQKMENSKMATKPILSLVKNEVSLGKEILLAWTLTNTSVPFNSNNSDYLLGKIEFVAKQTSKSGESAGNVVVNLDPSFSKATLYKTGQDSLNTPSPLTIAIKMEAVTEIIGCKSDDVCPTGQYCYQPPMPTCPEGAMCKMSAQAPAKYCKEKPITATPTPIDNVTPTATSCKTNSNCQSGYVCSSTPAGGCSKDANGRPMACASAPFCRQAEGINCSTNADCFSGYSCYQPPMKACPEGKFCPQVMPAKYCKAAPISSTPTPVVCKEQCPGTDGVLRSCNPPEANGSAQESLCNLAGRVEACGDVTYCCPKAGGTWTSNMSACQIATTTPTKTPTPTPSVPTKTPTPISCAVPDCKNGTIRTIQSVKVDSNSKTFCPTYVCEQITSCQYDYSIWSECNYGVQSRSISNPDKLGCSAPILKQTCDKPCSSDSNCSTGEVCVRPVQTTATNKYSPTISSMGYCSVKTTPLAYDLNEDGFINVLDLSVVIKNLFTNNAKADVNKDKTVDIADYSLVLKSLINREFIAY